MAVQRHPQVGVLVGIEAMGVVKVDEKAMKSGRERELDPEMEQ